MSPWWGHALGVVTVVMMLLFIGCWVWVWLPHHKRKFDALSRIPMHDETETGDEDDSP